MLKENLKLSKHFKFLKNKFFWIFVVFFVLGIFLRTYNLGSWLHFELDQSRDAMVVDNALAGGVAELPLLGPRAAGSFLRLGPISYYISYLFSLLINDSVIGSALPCAFFSILSMIVFYFLMKRYFSKSIALAAGAIFASSLFLITYARFTWNPNLLPFFILFFMYALLRATNEENKKMRGWWLVATAAALGILSQLHFLAMAIIFVVGVIYLIIKRPKIKILFWGLSVLTVFVLNFPLIVYDVETGGDNVNQLFETVNDKTDSKSSRNLLEKTVKNLAENSSMYWIILTGYQDFDMPEFSFSAKKIIDVECKEICRRNLLQETLAASFFAAGFLLLLWRTFREKDSQKKDFLILNLILFAVSAAVFTLLAYDLSPRFFLVVIALPFVFWGLVMAEISKFLRARNLIWILAMVFVAFNLYFTANLFTQLADAKNESIEMETDRIMKQKTRITLEQQEMIADYMAEQYNKNKYPIFYRAQSEYHRAFGYLLDRRQIPRDGMEAGDKSDICAHGNYFLIMRTQSDKTAFFVKYFSKFSIEGEKQFGTLTVYTLMPKPDSVNCLDADQSKFRSIDNDERYTWRKVFDEK